MGYAKTLGDAPVGRRRSGLGAASGAAVGAVAGSIIPGVGTAVGGVVGSILGGLGTNHAANNSRSNIQHMQALAATAEAGGPDGAAALTYLNGIARGQALASGPGTAWPWNSGIVNWGEQNQYRAAERSAAQQLVAAITSHQLSAVTGALNVVNIAPTTAQQITDSLTAAIQHGQIDPNDAQAVANFTTTLATRANAAAAATNGARAGAMTGAGVGALAAGFPGGILGLGLAGAALYTLLNKKRPGGRRARRSNPRRRRHARRRR